MEKQKNELEEKDKNEHISPETHYIITKTTYNKLIWYLVSTVSPKSKNEKEINTYKNYKWVTDLTLPKSQLSKYNKFDEEDQKIEDIIINKDNKNKKINMKSQNKTSNSNINIMGGTLFLNKLLNNDKSNNINKSNSNQNYTNKFNANTFLGGDQAGDMEKYKNLLDKLNDYSEREKLFQSEINKLKDQLRDKEDLQAGMNNIKDISKHFIESNFIEDDKDEKNVLDLLSSKNNYKNEKKEIKDEDNFLNILNDVPGNESDLDEVKQLKKLITFLKNDIKTKEKILNDLIVQIKELFKELKWSTKNNQTVSEILKILGYTPDIIKIIVNNRKGYNFDFNLKLKK